jgi:hypothetical protein
VFPDGVVGTLKAPARCSLHAQHHITHGRPKGIDKEQRRSFLRVSDG